MLSRSLFLISDFSVILKANWLHCTLQQKKGSGRLFSHRGHPLMNDLFLKLILSVFEIDPLQSCRGKSNINYLKSIGLVKSSNDWRETAILKLYSLGFKSHVV